jgi:hypothetical protein
MTTIILGLALLVPTVAAAMGPVDLNAEVGIFDRYVWRGITVNDNLVVQPELSAALGGFGLGVWGNYDADDKDGISGFNKYDVTLSYGLSLTMVSLDLGFIYYSFPDASDFNTTEAYAAASAGVLLSPSLTVYRDLDAVDGWYWEAGVNHGLALSPGATLDLAARLGLGSERYLAGYFPGADLGGLGEDPASSSLTDFMVTLSLPWHPIPLATVTPSVGWSTLLDDANTITEDNGGETDAVVLGLTGSISF